MHGSNSLEELFYLCPDPMVVIGPGGLLAAVNRSLARLVGVGRKELEGKPFRDLLHPDDLAVAELALEGGGTLTCRVRRSGGQHVALEWQLFQGAGGAFYGIGRPAEEGIESSSAGLRAVFEALPDLVFEVDRDHRYLRIKGSGGDEEALAGVPIAAHLPEAITEPLAAGIERAFASGEPQRFVARRLLDGGDESEWDYQITTTSNQTAVVVARDISRERAAQRELLSNNKILAQFASVIAHDLRAPMRAIGQLAGWIDEDDDTQLSPRSKRYFQLLLERICRLEYQLTGLATYVRAGALEAPIEEVDLGALIAEVTDEITADPRVAESGRSIEVSVGELPRLETARAPLRHCLVNLVSNAWKHHDRDRCHVAIQAHRHGHFWRISVVDDGPGIPTRHHDRIFGIFTTLVPKDQLEGSGMGLAIVARIMQSCGGRVSVKSPVAGDRGSSFELRWPARWPRG